MFDLKIVVEYILKNLSQYYIKNGILFLLVQPQFPVQFLRQPTASIPLPLLKIDHR